MPYRNYEDHKRNVRERIRAMTPEQKQQRAAYKKAHRLANLERYRQKDHDYYLANREKRSAEIKKNAHKYRLKSRLKVHGITPEDFFRILKKQGGRCAICGTTAPGGRSPRMRVDHCHSTGRVRGLLCNTCNAGIGLLKDSPEILKRAERYLRSHKL